MLLPSKLFSFSQSSLALIEPIHRLLTQGPHDPAALANELDLSVDELSHALGCMYALRAIDINDDGRVFSCL